MAAPGKSLKCPFCDAQIFPDDESCRNCGKKLGKEVVNGGRKGLGRALSEKYRKRVAKAEKKGRRETLLSETKRNAIELFSLIPNIGRARACRRVLCWSILYNFGISSTSCSRTER